MVGKGFTFVFFASQGPFMKIKTVKFFAVHMQNKRTVFQSVLLIYLAASRSESVSVPLKAIAEAIGNRSAM